MYHHVSSCIIILIPQSFLLIVTSSFNSFSPMHTLWLPATTSFSQPEKRMEAQDWKDVNPLPRSYGRIWSIEFNEWMNSKPRLDLNLDQLDTYRNKQRFFWLQVGMTSPPLKGHGVHLMPPRRFGSVKLPLNSSNCHGV